MKQSQLEKIDCQDQFLKIKQSDIEKEQNDRFNQIDFQHIEQKEDFQVYEEKPLQESQVIRQILETSDSSQESVKYLMKSDDGYIKNIFQINQLHKLEHLGCKSLNLNSIINHDYIKSYQDFNKYNTEKINQQIKYHQQPKIQLDQKLIQTLDLQNIDNSEKQNNPYKYMQPKLSLFLQIFSVDIRLYQNQSYDFMESAQEIFRMGFIDIDQLYNFIEIQNQLEEDQNNHMNILKQTRLQNQNSQLDINIKQSILNSQIEIQSNAILDMNYIQKQNMQKFNIQEVHLQELQQNIKDKYKMLNQMQTQFNFQRKKQPQPKCFHQFIIKNIMLSLYRLKIAIFKNKNELKSLNQIQHLLMQKQIVYKLERIGISIENLNIREDISTGQQGKYRIDTFQLPYSYKYNHFLDFVYTNKHLVTEKQIGLEISLQPFSYKMRQDVLKFLVQFFDVDLSKKSKEGEAYMYDQKDSFEYINNDYFLNSSQQLQNDMIEKANSINNNQTAKLNGIPIFIKQIKICKTQISFSYIVNSIQINEILNQNVDLMNLFNINNLTLQINQLDLNQKLKIDKAIEFLIKYYSDDILNNQKLQIIGAIGSMRYLFKFAGSLFAIANNAGKGITIFKVWSVETLSKFILYQ